MNVISVLVLRRRAQSFLVIVLDLFSDEVKIVSNVRDK